MPDIDVGGCRIHFEDSAEESGKGGGKDGREDKNLPLLLNHSFLCSGDMWRAQADALSRDRRVIRVDLRGHGRSGHATRAMRIGDLVEDSLAVLDALGIDAAVWGGLSIGGMIAQHAALGSPDRVRGLVLANTTAEAQDVLGRMRYKVLGLIASAIGFKPLLPQIRPLMFGRTALRDQPELAARWSRSTAELHVPSVRNILVGLNGREGVLDRLPDIRVPALVITGDEDLALAPAESERIAAALPDSRLATLPGVGHLSALEAPGRVTAAMREFLDGLDAAQSAPSRS